MSQPLLAVPATRSTKTSSDDRSTQETGEHPVLVYGSSVELDQIDETVKGVLSSTEILTELDSGNIVIEPFNRINLSNCSYDVTLGEYYFRHTPNPHDPLLIYVPWNPDHVRRYWGEPQTALQVRHDNQGASGLSQGTKYILIYPGETILAHTNEFIGGRTVPNSNRAITTMMKARSSMGRSGISICKDAGWGDIGYINRWTLEITNFAQVPVALLVGERIGQIVFFYTGHPVTTYSGSYQTSDDINTLRRTWTPMELLPKPKRDLHGQ